MKHVEKILLSKYVDKEIEDEKTKNEIKRHLNVCNYCMDIYNSYININSLIKNYDIKSDENPYLAFVEKKVKLSNSMKTNFRFSLSFGITLALIFLISFSLTLFATKRNVDFTKRVSTSVVDMSFDNFFSEDYSSVVSTVNFDK